MIEFLVATMNRTDVSFLKDMFSAVDDKNSYAVLVINQCTTIEVPDIMFSEDNVRVISVQDKGLARSRNLALRNAIGDYLVLADDDVVYKKDIVSKIDGAIKNYEGDVFVFQYEEQDEIKNKKYRLNAYDVKQKDIFNFCSVELVFNRKTIMSKAVIFDDNFGLGATGYPMGEENIFLSDCLKRGLNVRYVPEVILTHVGFTSGDKLSLDYQTWILKGELFVRLFGFKGIFITPLLALRHLSKFRIDTLFKIIFKSLFVGAKYFKKNIR